MFSPGDEIECVSNEPNVLGWRPPIEKGARFTVLGVYPVGSMIGPEAIMLEPCIAIGKENESLRRWIDQQRTSLYHYDLWPSHNFRKIERKRTREELHALIGISDMLGQRAPELV